MKVFYLKFDLALWELVICFFRLFFFKVGVGLKITHSERLPPSLTSFHFWKMSRGSRHIKKAHHLQPFLLLFTIKNWHYSSVPKMKISTSLTSFYIACCHNYCLNDITYSNGDFDAYLNRVTSTFIKTFYVVSFLSNMVHKTEIWQNLTTIVMTTFTFGTSFILFRSSETWTACHIWVHFGTQKFHKLLPMIFIARVPKIGEGASITVPI